MAEDAGITTTQVLNLMVESRRQGYEITCLPGSPLSKWQFKPPTR